MYLMFHQRLRRLRKGGELTVGTVLMRPPSRERGQRKLGARYRGLVCNRELCLHFKVAALEFDFALHFALHFYYISTAYYC